MKKFLTVLLALSVVFTYSFSAVGSAFAADSYDVSTARQELEKLVDPYMKSVNAAKTIVLQGYKYDTAGNCTAPGLTDYDKAAIEYAADTLEKAAEKAMTDAIDAQLKAINDAGGSVASLDTYIANVKAAVEQYCGDSDKDLTKEAGFKAALEDDKVTLNTSLEKTLYAATIKQIDEDYALSKYPATGAFKDTTSTITGKFTAQQVVDDAVKAAKKNIEDAHKAVADANETTLPTKLTDAIAAYKAADQQIKGYIANFEEDGTPVKTNEQIAIDKENADKDNTGKYASLRGYALNDYYKLLSADIKADLTGFVTKLGTTDDKDPLYVAANPAKKTNAVVVGVEVKDITAATAAEQKAIKDAFYKAINDTLAVAEVYAKDHDADSLYNATDSDGATFTRTIKNALQIADKYAEVKAYIESYKDVYEYGVKIYDDAKIDVVAKAAESEVYGDLGGAFATKDAYLIDAVNSAYEKSYTTKEDALDELKFEGVDKLETKFKAAQTEAKKKFDGRIITSGTDATPEADKVFKAELYDATSTTPAPDSKNYAAIVEEAKAAIDTAQTYDEIDAALATAKEKLGQLVLDADKTKVGNAKTDYVAAFNSYVDEQAKIMGSDYRPDSFVDVKAAGATMINEANTVDAVKAAYEKAKALVSDIKTDAAIKDAEDALKARVKALPYSTQVTAENKAEIEAARAAYDALAEMYGSNAYDEELLNTNVDYGKLVDAEAALAKLDKDALEKELDTMADKIAAIGPVNNDKAAEAAVALKEEAKVLQEKVEAYNKANAATPIANQELTDLNHFLANNVAGDTACAAEVYLVKKAINMLPAKISKDDKEAVEAARAAFDALTDVQQYAVENAGALDTLKKAEEQLAAVLEKEQIAAVESLKITVSTKLYKGSKIRVKWKVKGDASNIDGYQVYKSTKAQKGYKFMGKTKKLYMDNKKGLKKGTRYYYKVRAYKVVDGVKYYSDWSNKGNRIYKK